MSNNIIWILENQPLRNTLLNAPHVCENGRKGARRVEIRRSRFVAGAIFCEYTIVQ
jgi:hypothetical protein